MDLLAAAIRIATPLVLASLGGLLSERAGVFAVGLEGMMLAGAFAAALGSALGGVALGSALGGVALGLLASLAGGALIAGIVALVAVRGRADQMVTGLSANILALGLTGFGLRLGGGATHLEPLAAWHLPLLDRLPVLGPLFVQPPLTWLALAALPALAVVLGRTQAGLVLRATGENPDAVFAAGLDPARTRMLAVVGGGALAGLGGAVLPLQQVGAFTDDMTGGRGYLALASLIVGRWNPFGAALACLGFGAAEALELQLEAAGIVANPYLLQMLPYAAALAVLALLGRGARLPAAIGRPVSRP